MKKLNRAKEMSISQLASVCGVKSDTIRYYERIRLIRPDRRTASGYRMYSMSTAREVDFIKNAQKIGFTLEEAAKLIRLRSSDRASAEEVLRLAEHKIEQLSANIDQLKRIKQALKKLSGKCGGSKIKANHCPILEHLYSNHQRRA